jgi:hypothetical protein
MHDLGFADEVMVFACSATAVRLRHGYIQDRHKIFVTSARFAHEFNANRTKDDKLRVSTSFAAQLFSYIICFVYYFQAN